MTAVTEPLRSLDSALLVECRRQWNDWRIAKYRIDDIGGWHWTNVSGGINAAAPQNFVHGYVVCNAMISGELAHSCEHGPAPHRILVCITKKGNEKVWPMILERAGPRPPRKQSKP